ncbi:hypothetical protein Tco_0722653 [Tanacetum coccineum]
MILKLLAIKFKREEARLVSRSGSRLDQVSLVVDKIALVEQPVGPCEEVGPMVGPEPVEQMLAGLELEQTVAGLAHVESANYHYFKQFELEDLFGLPLLLEELDAMRSVGEDELLSNVVRKGEISKLKSSLEKFESEASKLVKLCSHVSELEAMVDSRNLELAGLGSKNAELLSQVSGLEALCNDLKEKIKGEVMLRREFKVVQDVDRERLNEDLAKLYGRLPPLKHDFDNKLSPNLLKATAGKRWSIGHCFRMTFLKSKESPKCNVKLRNCVSLAIWEGLCQGFEARLAYGQARRELKDIVFYDPTRRRGKHGLEDVDASLRLMQPVRDYGASCNRNLYLESTGVAPIITKPPSPLVKIVASSVDMTLMSTVVDGAGATITEVAGTGAGGDDQMLMLRPVLCVRVDLYICFYYTFGG